VHDAAILFSYDDLFAAIQHAEHLGMDPWRVLDEVVPLYESLERRGLGVTFARPQDDLSAFAAVFAPLTFVSTHAVADNLRRYVHDGGTLIAYNRTGHFDEFGKAQPQSLPAYMQDVFGATIGRVDEVPPGESIRAAISGVKNKTTLSCNRAQELVPTTARTLAKFTSSRIKGAAALTCNALGNGKAMLVGILKPDAPTHQKVTDIVLAQTKLPWQPPGNGDIECIRGDKLTGYINLREDKSVVLNLPRAQNELVSGRKVRRITLEAYGVAVFTNDK
jgi:beta-galactosidase